MTSAVKYTDIDYSVFSDAADCILDPNAPSCSSALGPLAQRVFAGQIGDPYARDTYRYTPLLAMLMLCNSILHESIGKVLFALSDLVVGVILYRLARHRGAPKHSATKQVALVWLLNPIIANISTRGSAEAILGILVVSVLSLAERQRWDAAAAVFGLAVHFKIYPVIYGSSLFAALSSKSRGRFSISTAHVRFGAISLVTFMALNLAMYSVWGWPFFRHAFLYHIDRLDHRHNFSPYFYPFYLGLDGPVAPNLLSQIVRHPLSAFVPQIGLSVALGFKFGSSDLPFAWLVQTMAFVAFNKVCTSQYFLWYLWFLPLTLSSLEMSRVRAITVVATWVAGQALWLSQAYRLEMLGQSVHIAVWWCSTLFLLINCWVLGQVVQAYRPVSENRLYTRKVQ